MITILVLMLVIFLVLNVPVGFALLAASMGSLAYGARGAAHDHGG